MKAHTIYGGGDIELYVEERGDPDDSAVIFLHGYSQSRLSWRKQFESSLTDDFRLIRIDSRGHGESEKPCSTDAYTNPSLWAADVHAVLDAFDVEKAVIVAWSYGCLPALDYLSAYGTDHVAGVNFVGVVSGMGTNPATELLGPQYLDLFPDLISHDAETSITALEMLVNICVHGDLSPDERYFMLGYNVVVPPVARDGMRSRTLSHRETLADLDIPVLFSHGEKDRVVKPKAVSANADLVADARTSCYADVGHSPFWESPNRFNNELAEFIRDVGVLNDEG